MMLGLLMLACPSEPDPDPTTEPEPEPTAVTGTTATTATTGTTGDTALPVAPELTLGALERWSLDDESEPQHHAAVAWTSDGHLAVAWTNDEVYEQPASWLRVFAPDGTQLADPVQVAVGLQAAKPDIDDTPDGDLIVGAEVDDMGIGIEVVELPSLTMRRTLIADAIPTVGNNSLDLVVRDDHAVLATWYAGDFGLPAAAFFTGGLDPTGAVVEEVAFTNTAHVWPAPPDIAVQPAGGFVIGWSNVRTDKKGSPLDVEVALTTFGADRSEQQTYTLTNLGGGLRTPPRPSVAVNGAGQLAVGYNTETGPDEPEALLTFLELDTDVVVLRAATSLGQDTDLISVAFVGDDTVCVVWEGPGKASPEDPSIWMSLLRYPDGAERVAPQRISDPQVNAIRPNLDVRDAGGGRFDIAFVWEQLNPQGMRTVWGRRATWGAP